MSQTHAIEINTLHDKAAIAHSFSRAAKHYDVHAAFQRDVGQRLLDKMPRNLVGKRVFDLGCGTGLFFRATAA